MLSGETLWWYIDFIRVVAHLLSHNLPGHACHVSFATNRVYSEILDEMVPFHLTTSALRSIDNAGGLDNYLLTSRHVTSGEGLVAKNRIIERLKYLQRVENRKQQEAAVAAGGGGGSDDATKSTNE